MKRVVFNLPGKAIFFYLILAVVELNGQELPVPPLLEGPNVFLEAQTGSLELPWGTSNTFGYNGNFLGPTLRLRKGQQVSIDVKNSIGENTTVHWHGLHVPAEFDGGPHQQIGRGETWRPRFVINQEAATLWYHPHLMGKTAEHVYKGLAGLFIIDDEFSDNLNIPDRYGENDIPLILQDRRINENGQFIYRPAMPDVMHGYLGNVVLINGAVQPDLSLRAGTYRFRILNGSNSSIMRVSLKSSRSVTVIAGDGGFLPESVEMEQLVISPGERYEVLVDFKAGDRDVFVTEIYGGSSFDAMRILVADTANVPENAYRGTGQFYRHPKKIKDRASESSSDGTNLYEALNLQGFAKRKFVLETRGMMGFSINGQVMDIDTVNIRIPLGSKEVWTIENARVMMNLPHSFHLHDVQFRVLSIDGQEPPPHLRGPKDTILLFAGQKAELAMQFRDYTGIYMYHCHLLEHEESGMMGQFEVFR